MDKDLEKTIIDDLRSNWNRCGLYEGDVAIVYSSLKRLLTLLTEKYGPRGGKVSPKTVYDSLLATLGEEGTLLLPLFNFEAFPKNKYFHFHETPSKMGALTEVGRTQEDSVRTGHPIYSFAVIGKRAHEFKGLNNKSGYGADSPFGKVLEMDGKTVAIGLPDQHSMTHYHYVEEQNQVDYRYFKDFTGTYIDENYNEEIRTYSLFVRDIEKGVVTRVNRMMDRFWERGIYTGDKWDEGYGMRVATCKDFYDEVTEVIQSGQAINYLYMIDKEKAKL